MDGSWSTLYPVASFEVHIESKELTMENTPDNNHTSSDILGEPVYSSTPVGETKIPDPMMLPTMTVTPFKSVILADNRMPSSSCDNWM